MQKMHNEFASITASPKDQNAFCQAFVEMVSLDDSKDDLQASLQYYDELKKDNISKLKALLDEKLLEMIESSKNL